MVGGAPRSSEAGGQTEAGADDLRDDQRGSPLTLYLDSSALAKLFIEEEHRGAVVDLVSARTDASVTSRLSYVECGAAFARKRRGGHLSSSQIAVVFDEFDEAWRRLAVVELDATVAASAVATAREHTVRAADAVHLASALVLADGDPSLVTFACFDRRLWEAAGALGFTRFPPLL